MSVTVSCPRASAPVNATRQAPSRTRPICLCMVLFQLSRAGIFPHGIACCRIPHRTARRQPSLNLRGCRFGSHARETVAILACSSIT